MVVVRSHTLYTHIIHRITFAQFAGYFSGLFSQRKLSQKLWPFLLTAGGGFERNGQNKNNRLLLEKLFCKGEDLYILCGFVVSFCFLMTFEAM